MSAPTATPSMCRMELPRFRRPRQTWARPPPHCVFSSACFHPPCVLSECAMQHRCCGANVGSTQGATATLSGNALPGTLTDTALSFTLRGARGCRLDAGFTREADSASLQRLTGRPAIELQGRGDVAVSSGGRCQSGVPLPLSPMLAHPMAAVGPAGAGVAVWHLRLRDNCPSSSRMLFPGRVPTGGRIGGRVADVIFAPAEISPRIQLHTSDGVVATGGIEPPTSRL